MELVKNQTENQISETNPMMNGSEKTPIFSLNLPELKTHEDLKICPICFGCGMEVVPGKGARKCACRRPRYRQSIIERIPGKLKTGGIPLLANLEAKADLHRDPEIADKIYEAQRTLIAQIKKTPRRNLFLSGDNGCGKTHIAYAVLIDALDEGRTVVACTVSELLEDYRRFVNAPRETVAHNIPRIQAEDLKQSTKKYTILLDEADKPTASEFRGEMLFGLLNEASNFGHQIISTSNKKIRDFINHWSKYDDTHGNSIAKRLTEDATGYKAFWT